MARHPLKQHGAEKTHGASAEHGGFSAVLQAKAPVLLVHHDQLVELVLAAVAGSMPSPDEGTVIGGEPVARMLDLFVEFKQVHARQLLHDLCVPRHAEGVDVWPACL